MNTKSAKKVIQENGMTFLRWNGQFNEATIRTPDGQTTTVHIDGGKEKLLKRLSKLKPSSASQPTM
jgi:hypothetical protein